MPRIDMTGSIGSLLSFYKHERNIFGRCPHCGEPFRISEVKLTYGKEPPRDLLARLKRDRDQLREQLEELETGIQDTEDQHSDELAMLNERWTDKVENEVDKRLGKREKEIRQKAIGNPPIPNRTQKQNSCSLRQHSFRWQATIGLVGAFVIVKP